ncbi:MAG: AAA family ATPase [Spirochaetota bacterium]
MSAPIIDDLPGQVRCAMLNAGITPPDSLTFDGEIHRFATKDGTDDAGWYILHEDAISAGAFGDWRTGIKKNFVANTSRPLTDDERLEASRRAEAGKLRAASERAERQAIAAKEVEATWSRASAAPADHPYLVEKGIKAHGALASDDGRLILPLFDSGGAMTSLEYIDARGEKRFHPGGKVKGAFNLLGTPRRRIFIAEGFATAASIFEATGEAVAVAFSAGNLTPVTGALRTRYPNAALVIVADNDESGTGAKAAAEAAQLYGAHFILIPNEGQDANDFVQAGGNLGGLLAEPSRPFILSDVGQAARLLEAEAARKKRLAGLPRGMTCSELLAAKFPPPAWIVPGLLTTGLTILAGAPKLGKSWLALAMGYAVGSGGAVLGRYRVDRRRALYLALEDVPRRLQTRLEKIGAQPGSSLDLFTEWRSGAEGIADLDAWLLEKPETKLVLIDTLARFRGRPEAGESMYDADYRLTAAIKTLADKHDCAIVCIHHVRKMAAEDIMETVSGSNGINGAADSTWVLNRARGAADATLFVTGRDVEEQSLALHFDGDCGTWKVLGDAAEYAMSTDRREILELVRKNPMKPKSIGDALGKNPSTVRNLLAKMVKADELRVDQDGKYSPCLRAVDTVDDVDSSAGLPGLSTASTLSTPFQTPTAESWDRLAPETPGLFGNEAEVPSDLSFLN